MNTFSPSIFFDVFSPTFQPVSSTVEFILLENMFASFRQFRIFGRPFSTCLTVCRHFKPFNWKQQKSIPYNWALNKMFPILAYSGIIPVEMTSTCITDKFSRILHISKTESSAISSSPFIAMVKAAPTRRGHVSTEKSPPTGADAVRQKFVSAWFCCYTVITVRLQM